MWIFILQNQLHKLCSHVELKEDTKYRHYNIHKAYNRMKMSGKSRNNMKVFEWDKRIEMEENLDEWC